MSKESLSLALLKMRQYFDSGATRLFSFRRQQLLTLRRAVFKYEAEINRALFFDLKKTPEEAWVTETGLLLRK